MFLEPATTGSVLLFSSSLLSVTNLAVRLHPLLLAVNSYPVLSLRAERYIAHRVPLIIKCRGKEEKKRYIITHSRDVIIIITGLVAARGASERWTPLFIWRYWRVATIHIQSFFTCRDGEL